MALRYLWNPRAVGTPELSCATAVAFARAGRASDETVIAFARSCACGVETAIAFADEKELFWARFSVALVMAVSRWPASAVAVVAVVAPSRRHSVQCAKKFALLGLMVGMSAKKFAMRAQNGPIMVFSGALGELFRERAAEEAGCRANYFAEHRCCGRSSRARRAQQANRAQQALRALRN